MDFLVAAFYPIPMIQKTEIRFKYILRSIITIFLRVNLSLSIENSSSISRIRISKMAKSLSLSSLRSKSKYEALSLAESQLGQFPRERSFDFRDAQHRAEIRERGGGGEIGKNTRRAAFFHCARTTVKTVFSSRLR